MEESGGNLGGSGSLESGWNFEESGGEWSILERAVLPVGHDAIVDGNKKCCLIFYARKMYKTERIPN